METMGAKLVAAVILLGVPAIASVGAWLVLRWGRGYRGGRGLTALNCLAGGVFLGTCFLHLAVEGRERWADYLQDSGRSVDFPVFEAIMVSGLFVVLLLDSTASFAARKFALWSMRHRQELVVVVSSQGASSQSGRHCGRANAGFLPDTTDGKDVNCSARETVDEDLVCRDGQQASAACFPDPRTQRELESMAEPADGVTRQLLGNVAEERVRGSDDAPECRLLMEFCSECAEESREDLSKSSSILREWSLKSENLDEVDDLNCNCMAVEKSKANIPLPRGHVPDSISETHPSPVAEKADSVSLKNVSLSDNWSNQTSNSSSQTAPPSIHSTGASPDSTTATVKPFLHRASHKRQASVEGGCSVSMHVTQKCDHSGCVAPSENIKSTVDTCDATRRNDENLSSSNASSAVIACRDLNASEQVKSTTLPSTQPQTDKAKPSDRLGAACVASPSSDLKNRPPPRGSGDKPCGASCRLLAGGKGDKESWDSPSPGSMGLVVLVMALAFHTVFDGLAVGLQASVSAVWQTTGVISLHRGVVTFCLALQLLPALRPRAALPLLALSALAAPLGLLLGLVVTSASDVSGVGGNALACSALQGLAAGTFLYVTFFEILKDELVREGHPVKVVLVMAGFAVSAGLKCIDV